MINRRPIYAILLTGMITAWVAVPMAVYAAGTTDSKQAAIDLRSRQETELRKVLANDPNNAAAHLQLARLYLDGGRYPAAEDEARAAQKGEAKIADQADGLLAWLIFLQGDRDRLISTVRPGNRDPQSESQVRMSLGVAQLTGPNLDRAEAMLRDAVRLDPSSWRAHEAYARYLILVRKLPEARAELAAAQAMAPNEVGPKRIAAQLDRAAGDTNAAIAGYTEVLKANPTSIPSLAGRADALIAQDKLAEAQADLTTAVKMNGHSQLAYLEALVLARQGKLSEASQLLLSANRFFRSFRVGYYLYGVIDYRLNLSENADSSLARFQAQQPNVSGVVRVRAQLAIQNRDLAGAIKLLSEFVKTNPADQNAVTMLARAYLINHQPDDVIALYEQLASAPPRQGPPEADPKTLIAIYGDAAGDLPAIEKVIMHEAPDVVPAMTALRQGDLDMAAQMAETLANSEPDDSWTQNLLGTVRLAQKRWPDAEAIFRRVLDKHPDFAASGFNLVQALVAQHRTDEAKLMLQDLSRRKLDDSVI